MKNILTLCFIRENTRLLLGMKKSGFGEGKWNGFGGKVETDESIKTAAEREVFEESGLQVHLTPEDKYGVLDFVYVDKIHEVHIYSTSRYRGVLTETEEMKPQWFAVEDIPYREMWEDDQYWLPLLLDEKKFKGEFIFNKNEKLVTHTLKCSM